MHFTHTVTIGHYESYRIVSLSMPLNDPWPEFQAGLSATGYSWAFLFLLFQRLISSVAWLIITKFWRIWWWHECITRKPSWCKGYMWHCLHLANALEVWQRKFQRKFELIAIQGHARLIGASQKCKCSFLVVVNSKFQMVIRRTIFEILMHKARKYHVSPPHPCLNLVQLEIAPFDPPTQHARAQCVCIAWVAFCMLLSRSIE